MFSWSENEESYHGEFATREEAIREGFAESDHDVIFTGENRPPDVLFGITADDLLERIKCLDDFQVEQAEDWPKCNKEQEDELTAMLRETFKRWMKKYKLEPTFWLVEKVREHHREDYKKEK